MSEQNTSLYYQMMPLHVMLTWSRRRWMTVVVAAVGTALAIGLPTDVIPNPVFGRQGTPVTWWSYPVLGLTSVLSGLLFATYVRQDEGRRELTEKVEQEEPSLSGMIGGVLSFFAVGCPICNKVVVIALGTSGALTWFAPIQPYLGIVSLALVGYALRVRLNGEVACPVSVASTDSA